MTLPDDTVIYPGHSRETTIGAERRENPYVTGKRDTSYWLIPPFNKPPNIRLF